MRGLCATRFSSSHKKCLRDTQSVLDISCNQRLPPLTSEAKRIELIVGSRAFNQRFHFYTHAHPTANQIADDNAILHLTLVKRAPTDNSPYLTNAGLNVM